MRCRAEWTQSDFHWLKICAHICLELLVVVQCVLRNADGLLFQGLMDKSSTSYFNTGCVRMWAPTVCGLRPRPAQAWATQNAVSLRLRVSSIRGRATLGVSLLHPHISSSLGHQHVTRQRKLNSEALMRFQQCTFGTHAVINTIQRPTPIPKRNQAEEVTSMREPSASQSLMSKTWQAHADKPKAKPRTTAYPNV